MGSPGGNSQPAQDSPPAQTLPPEGGVPPKKPGSKGVGRKRTKSGCLTCRKRRVKCGEEKPACQNCTKSKRHCEGYNQRVVFKDPLNFYRPSLSSRSQSSIQISSTLKPNQHATGENSLSIAPRPGPSEPPPTLRDPIFSTGVYHEVKNEARHFSKTEHFVITDKSQASQDHLAHHEFNALVRQQGRNITLQDSLNRTSPDLSASQTAIAGPPHNSFLGPPNFIASAQFDTGLYPLQTPLQSYSWFHTDPQSTKDLSVQVEHNTERYRQPGPQNERAAKFIQHLEDAPRVERSSQPVHATTDWVEEDADDPFDVSDDDIDMDDSGSWQDELQVHLRNNDLGVVVALQASQDRHGLNPRLFTSFLNQENVLATYIPSSQATPLRDAVTARVFCHFINVTAPAISMYERHPANPSLIFRGSPVPISQQHMWTYTFPTLALTNPALLHAMLAVASLHIEKLQNTPVTASLKHYHLGLRRLAKLLSIPMRRGHPSTLAAAMLLAFYECWSADHQKWTNHLLGARQLVREIDFAGMTSYLLRKRIEQRRKGKGRCPENSFGPEQEIYDQPYLEAVDENLVGILMGRNIRYDRFGQIVDNGNSPEAWDKDYKERDLEIYETQRDLFWWYCKQDVYQAILGGGNLFMEYSLWSHCPPRAPMNRSNATYGTYDHLILLMGRLATFIAKDLRRKRRAIRFNGGRWKPPEGMRPPGPPGPPQGGPPPQITPPTIPSFSGMVPNVGEARLPLGFDSTSPSTSSPESTSDSTPESQSDEAAIELQVQTREAEVEWSSILEAFHFFKSELGEAFQPLDPEYSTTIETPFGTALQYRTYGIAGIWMNYYMAIIACHRAKPSMPPAAMMAAGITAGETREYAGEVGRISGGICPESEMAQSVNPGVGAGLIESATCIFVAAIQYQNPVQRQWIITRLHSIARLTGWQTALAIANGCETSWIKTFEAGRGAPYTRIAEHHWTPSSRRHTSSSYIERRVHDIDAGEEGTGSERRIDRALKGRTIDEARRVVEGDERVHYALGVLSLESDFESLDADR